MSRLIGLIALLAPSVGSAADLVLNDGGDSVALLERVARDAGVAATSLEVAGVRDVLAGSRPVLVGPGRLMPCDVPPVGLGVLEAGLDRATRSLNYVRLGDAVLELETAEGQLDCLSDPLDARLAGRIHFLHGMVAYKAGSESEARDFFGRARGLVPDMVWDDNFAPDGAVVFDSVVLDSDAAVSLTLVPASAATEVRVDGQSVEGAVLALSEGKHWIQVGGGRVTTVAVELEAGDHTLTLPSVLADSAYLWAADDVLGADLLTSLEAARGVDQTVYARVRDQVFVGTTGRPGWTALRQAVDDPALVRQRALSTHRVITTTTGGALALTGVTVAAMSRSQGRAVVRQTLSSIEERQRAEEDLHHLRQQGAWGEALVGAGAGAVVGGVLDRVDGPVLTGVGVGLSAVGALTIGVSVLRMSAVRAGTDVSDPAGHASSLKAHENWQGIYHAGWTTSAAGVGLLSVRLTRPRERHAQQVSVGVMPTGASLAWTGW